MLSQVSGQDGELLEWALKHGRHKVAFVIFNQEVSFRVIFLPGVLRLVELLEI